MIERLHQALERIDELSPVMQEELAQRIEDLTGGLPSASGTSPVVQGRIQTALSLAGAWSDMPDTFDEMLEALDHIRHDSPPTPPMDEQLAWLDDPTNKEVSNE